VSANLDPNRGGPDMLISEMETGKRWIEQHFIQEVREEPRSEVCGRRIEFRTFDTGNDRAEMRMRSIHVEEYWRRTMSRFQVLKYHVARRGPIYWHVNLAVAILMFLAVIAVWMLASGLIGIQILSDFDAGMVAALLSMIFGISTSLLFAMKCPPEKGAAFENVELILETRPWEKIDSIENVGEWQCATHINNAAE